MHLPRWLRALALVTGAVPLAAHAQPGTAADSAQVLLAIWQREQSNRMALGQPVLRALTSADTAEGVRFSPAVWRLLAREGVATVSPRTVGDDTNVVSVTRWRRENGRQLLTVSTQWTTVIGRGRRPCRTGGGNTGTYVAARMGTRWTVEPIGPWTHGTRVCVPLATDSVPAPPQTAPLPPPIDRVRLPVRRPPDALAVPPA